MSLILRTISLFLLLPLSLLHVPPASPASCQMQGMASNQSSMPCCQAMVSADFSMEKISSTQCPCHLQKQPESAITHSIVHEILLKHGSSLTKHAPTCANIDIGTKPTNQLLKRPPSRTFLSDLSIYDFVGSYLI